MTSNVGARRLKDFGTGVGFGTSAQKEQESANARGVIENALKKAFAPEFLNRIDDVVVFNNLERVHIDKIIDIELLKLLNRISELGYKLKLSKKAKDFIADKGFDEKYGARPLNRAIQKYIEDPLAEEIIQKSIKENDIIKMDYNSKMDKITVAVSTPKKKSTDNKKEEKK